MTRKQKAAVYELAAEDVAVGRCRFSCTAIRYYSTAKFEQCYRETTGIDSDPNENFQLDDSPDYQREVRVLNLLLMAEIVRCGDADPLPADG